MLDVNALGILLPSHARSPESKLVFEGGGFAGNTFRSSLGVYVNIGRGWGAPVGGSEGLFNVLYTMKETKKLFPSRRSLGGVTWITPKSRWMSSSRTSTKSIYYGRSVTR